jgi:diguanylate cyclase (GGDEF)-like protein
MLSLKYSLFSYNIGIVINDLLSFTDGIETDKLTGFLTRLSAYKLLESLYKQLNSKNITAISFELSRFGGIVDCIGGLSGDDVLRLVSKRLRKIFPQALAIARMHGDHFIVFFYNLDVPTEQVEKLLDFAQRPLVLKGGHITVLSLRVGVVHQCSFIKNGEELIRAAEIALHRAGNDLIKVVYFDSSMVEEAKASHQIENDLRVSLATNAAELHHAISNNEFCLHYQPIVNITQGYIHGYEALIRWYHPTRGLVSPADFIPLAEKISVMDILGDWIIRKACTDAVNFPITESGHIPTVSINISPTQFIEGELLIKSIETALKETQIDPERISFEITESSLISDDMHKYLHKIRALGCSISLDDFGTGYSSLSQVNSLPLNYVKIDRSFIKDLCRSDSIRSTRATNLCRSILAISDVLSLTSIVEGVETEEQLSLVKEMGAELIQGFIFSKPLDFENINNFSL